MRGAQDTAENGRKCTAPVPDSVPFLPLEIVVEIMSWMQVKSLLRFKCVCKQWHAIVEDQKFVKMHMRRNKGVLLKHRGEIQNVDGTVEEYVFLDSCHGLLLERRIRSSAIISSPIRSSPMYRITNPSTRHLLHLPNPHQDVMFIMFFHSFTDTYKLVSLSHVKESKNVIWEVLDIEDNLSWRPLESFKLYDFNAQDERISLLKPIDGILHCLRFVDAGSRNAEIVSLDLETEVFTSSIVSRSFFVDWKYVNFTTWNGKPSLFCLVEEELHVWVLEDHKKHKWADRKIVVPLPFCKGNPSMEKFVPYIAIDGNIALISNKVEERVEYIFYQIELKEVTKFQGPHLKYNVFNRASLVKLKGMKQLLLK